MKFAQPLSAQHIYVYIYKILGNKCGILFVKQKVTQTWTESHPVGVQTHSPMHALQAFTFIDTRTRTHKFESQ